MAFDELARRLRRSRLVGPCADAVDASVSTLIPHRAPMLLVDRVTGLDREAREIRGERVVSATDPVFAGHFPHAPVYPGVLQLEMMGQLGLCLLALLEEEPVDARLMKVHHGCFLAPVGPGARVTVEAAAVEHDPLAAVVAGQVWVDDTLCSAGVMEVVFA